MDRIPYLSAQDAFAPDEKLRSVDDLAREDDECIFGNAGHDAPSSDIKTVP